MEIGRWLILACLSRFVPQSVVVALLIVDASPVKNASGVLLLGSIVCRRLIAKRLKVDDAAAQRPPAERRPLCHVVRPDAAPVRPPAGGSLCGGFVMASGAAGRILPGTSIDGERVQSRGE